MYIGSILVGLALFFAGTFVITRPWWGHPAPKQADAPLRLASLETQRDATYAALADLEFDHSAGKVNEEDYRLVHARLMAQAVGVLRQLDAVADVETQIEALVRSHRDQRALRVPTRTGLRTAGCPACGSAVAANDRFCGRCGAALIQEEAAA